MISTRHACGSLPAIWLCLLAVIVPGLLFAPGSAYGAPSSPIVVSLGDSYSSGEGNPPFYGSNNPDDPDYDSYISHRSQKSWPGRLRVPNGSKWITLSEHKDENWFFFARSGAVARTEKAKKGNHIDSQLELIDNAGLDGSMNYVTLTLGGNDMGFADVITNSYLYGNYLDRSYLTGRVKDAWDDYEALRIRLLETYRAINDRCAEDAVIIVAGYPTLLHGRSALRSDIIETLANNIATYSASRVNAKLGEMVHSGLSSYFRNADFLNLRLRQDVWVGSRHLKPPSCPAVAAAGPSI